MSKISNILSKALSAAILLTMFGCSSTSENIVHVSDEIIPVYKEPEINGKKVLAQLEKTDSGYRFTSFSFFSNNRSNALQVSLNTGRHINGDNKTVEECVSGVMADEPDSYSSLRGCKTEDPAKFRKHSASEKMVQNIMMGVMTAGLMTATARNGIVRFDVEAYDEAYKEARRNFYYADLRGKDAIKKFIYDIDKKFEAHRRKSEYMKKSYLVSVNEYRFVENINNQSGFKNIDFGGFSRLQPQNLKIWNGSGTSSKTPDEFAANVDLSFTEYLSEADSLTAKALVYCNNTQPDFNVEFLCPSQINLAEENATFSAAIKSRNVLDYLPALAFSDENLNVELVDKKLTVTNKSTKFIEIEELSLYKETQIIKVPLSDSLRLSPNEKGQFIIQRNIIHKLYIDLKNQTKQQLDNVNVEYAVALRYRVSTGSSSTQDLTFYRNTLINIGESI